MTLFNLGVAQPLYDLLGRNPEFFIVQRSKPVDLILLVFTLSILMPGLLVLLIYLVGKVSESVRKVIYSIAFPTLCLLILIPLFKKLEAFSAWPLFVASSLPGVGIFIAAKRSTTVQLFLKYLSVSVLVIPALFLLNRSVSKILNSGPQEFPVVKKVGATSPVVVLLLDELPLVSLLDENENIDSVRFPNFARLQKDSLWFRNATTVADGTPEAVSAILTGKYPEDSRLPILRDYPENLFTMLAGSYELKVVELVTKMCPENVNVAAEPQRSLKERMSLLFLDLSAVYLHIVLPEEFSGELPSVKQTWGKFWQQNRSGNVIVSVGDDYSQRTKQFSDFLSLIQPTKKSCLYFQHIFLPHVPWEYLPSGKVYDYRGYGPMGVEGLSVKEEKWMNDDWVVYRGYQRHLLQVCYVDRLLGELIDQLKKTQIYDSALVVVTADHGASFQPGDSYRSVSSTNYQEIMAVPLFIKLPGSTNGAVIHRNVESIDILPTIADALEIHPDSQFDGSSALGDTERPRAKKRIFSTVFSRDHQWMEYDSKLFELSRLVERKINLFGTGSYRKILELWAYPELKESRPNNFMIAGNSRITIELKSPALFQNVDLRSGLVPVFIAGRVILQHSRQENLLLGVWINGSFCGVTRTFPADKNVQGWLKTAWLRSSSSDIQSISGVEGIHGFGIVVPELSFIQGTNVIQVLNLQAWVNNGSLQFSLP